MGLTALSVVCSVWTSSLYHRCTSTCQVPRCLRSAARVLNRLVRVHDDDAFQTSLRDVCKRTDMQHFGFRIPQRLAWRRNNLSKTTPRDANKRLSSPSPSGGSTADFKMAATTACQACAQQAQVDFRSGSGNSERRCCDTGPSQTDRYVQVMNELLRKLSALLQRQDAILTQVRTIGRQHDVNAEWRQVSQVLDRFFFWVFLVLTLTATVVILILVPLAKDISYEHNFV